jgi:hypothetical protein
MQPSDARINSNAAETPETAAVDDVLSIRGLSSVTFLTFRMNHSLCDQIQMHGSTKAAGFQSNITTYNSTNQEVVLRG